MNNLTLINQIFYQFNLKYVKTKLERKFVPRMNKATKETRYIFLKAQCKQEIREGNKRNLCNQSMPNRKP